ncbi:hypothetical protein DES53_12085 [Roseimicrobium gellanilyticum]|uniref:DUF1990 domain-containing protein n=1 Tax=Roseimicrobium gellanilyticum TaxID=748857 RepID=A0A366H371_9BACT|nr:hypothetical protein [Roseimicrobium gellanilyticum]RBP35716.1 hypothetical protein DES53_12085 [Roseimicrobium gellanilyticum]
MLRFAYNIFLVAWFGLCTAAVIQTHRAADWSKLKGLDHAAKNNTPPLMDRMEQTVWRRNSSLELSEEDVNRYLAATIAGHQVGFTGSLKPFDRVALDFEPGVARICLAWGGANEKHSTTASLDFTVKREGGNFVVEVQSGAFGRLPLPRGLMSPLVPGLQSLSESLRSEIHTVFQMNQIRFEKDKVILDPRSETVKS